MRHSIVYRPIIVKINLAKVQRFVYLTVTLIPRLCALSITVATDYWLISANHDRSTLSHDRVPIHFTTQKIALKIHTF